MSAPPVNTIQEYFKTRMPDLEKFLPGFNYTVAEAAAMAFYWRRIFPADAEPYNLNESRLSELQKTLIALKVVASAVPQLLAAASSASSISKATSGPESFEFEERAKYYNSMVKAWQSELAGMEAALGLLTSMAAKVPPFRVAVLR